MLDIHMIPSPGFEQGYLEQAARLRHELITLHEGRFVRGDMLAARSSSYALGSAPYVSWVDPDDEVLDTSWVTGAIELMERDRSVSAVYPRWISTRAGKLVYTAPIHEFNRRNFNRGTLALGHTFTIMRRQNVLATFEALKRRVSSFQNRVDVLLVHSQMRYGRCVPEPTIAYNWKLREQSGRTLMNDPATVAAGRAFMQETLIASTRLGSS